MKKFFLFIFIVVDAVVIAVCGLFLYSRMAPNAPSPLSSINIPGLHLPLMASTPSQSMATSTPTPAPSTTPAAQAPAATNPLTAAAPASNGTARKILFTYRNSKAKKVMIRADFTGWRAEPMQKDPATNVWKYTGVLEPGEYAYCYSVDDKSIRDPANKRTKMVGKTFVSSIVVQALPGGKS